MSSNQFTFTGKVTLNLLTNAAIVHGSNSNAGFTFPNLTTLLADSSNYIQWQPPGTTVPTSLQNITIPQFLQIPIWQNNSRITTALTANGVFKNGTGLGGNIIYNVSDGNQTYGQNIAIPSAVPAGDPRTRWGSATPTIINNQVGFSSFGVPASAAISNPMNGAFNIYADTYNVNFILEITVSASISCTGRNLDTGVCVNLCTADQASVTQCTNSYINYCTAINPTTNEPVITSSQNCQNFMENLLAREGPNSAFSAPITTYCTSKYRGFGDLFSPPAGTTVPEIDKQLCACNMSDQEYTEFQDNVEKILPPAVRSLYDVPARCFVPQCVSSRYPGPTIPQGGCKVPPCLQIQVFENNGSFQGGVSQSQECNASNKPDGVPTWVIVVLIVIFILLAVILYTIS